MAPRSRTRLSSTEVRDSFIQQLIRIKCYLIHEVTGGSGRKGKYSAAFDALHQKKRTKYSAYFISLFLFLLFNEIEKKDADEYRKAMIKYEKIVL